MRPQPGDGVPGGGCFYRRLQQRRQLRACSVFLVVEGCQQQRWIVGKSLQQTQLRTQGKYRRFPARMRFLQVAQHLQTNIVLVVERGIQGVEHKHGYRIPRLKGKLIAKNTWWEFRQLYLERLRSGVLLEGGDDLGMAVLRHPKILLAQTLDRTAILGGDHNVENDDPFICPEDAASVLSHRT